MSATALFTAVIALLLLRVFWLKVKASGTQNENFRHLPPKDQLSVLKECLMNNPSERNLQNLGKFISEQRLDQDIESYRPFMKKQTELSRKKDALAEDNELYTQESIWMDQIEPLEFSEAKAALSEGNKTLFVTRSLEGISRLYSDDAIENALKSITPHYPKAEQLLKGYQQLIEARDTSEADDKSLEALRRLRDKWEEDLLNIQEQ